MPPAPGSHGAPNGTGIVPLQLRREISGHPLVWESELALLDRACGQRRHGLMAYRRGEGRYDVCCVDASHQRWVRDVPESALPVGTVVGGDADCRRSYARRALALSAAGSV